jgi:GntR family transcriptional repressor for pyruvate dehydrogenase complex
VAKRATVNTTPTADNPPAGKPRQIADELRGIIIAGGLDEGDLLGTEADLLERFDVSRPSMREALRILQAEGLISVTRGALGGVVVHRPDQRMTARAAAVVLQSRSVSLSDVFEASTVIVPAAARMVAASRGHKKAAERLREIVIDQKRSIADPLSSTAAMIRFHSELVAICGNQTLILVCEMLNEVVTRAIADVLSRTKNQTPASRRQAIRAHEKLVEFIAAGDGDGAQAYWSGQMAKLRDSLLGDQASAVVDINRHI